MLETMHAEIVVVGGGIAGYTAALRLAKAGLSCVLVESGFIGGACLNSGCVPTKYLLGASAHLHRPKQPWDEPMTPCSLNLLNLQKNKLTYLEANRHSLANKLLEAGVQVLNGKASFQSPSSLEVKGVQHSYTLSFDKCILAVGSVPNSFPHLKADGAAIIGSAAAINLNSPPESMILVGGGAISLELGCFYHRLGTKIKLVERAARFLPLEEPEVAETVQAFYEGLGWEFVIGKEIAGVSTKNNEAVLVFENGEEIFAEKALVAIGRKANPSGLNLDKAGINTSPKGFIAVDEYLCCAKNIYAVGDCNGSVLLANAGADQGEYIANCLLGLSNAAYEASVLPLCVYGTMEFLRIGLTEFSLQQKGFKVKATLASFKDNHISQSYGYPEGFIKALWIDEKLVGLSAVGHGCTHLAGLASFMIKKKIKKNHDLGVAFAIPSLDETLKSAILFSTERDIDNMISVNKISGC